MSTYSIPKVTNYPVPVANSKIQSAPIRNQISNIVTALEGGNLATGNVDTTEVATLATTNTWTAAQTFSNTVTVGVDDTGYDVQFFGATSGAHLLWDESADTLKLVGGAATNLQGTLTVGVDDTGYDVKFFGATSGAYALWDESADLQVFSNGAGVVVGHTARITSDVAAEMQVHGTAAADATFTIGAWSGTQTTSGRLQFVKSVGAIGTYTATGDGETLGTIDWYGSDSSNTISGSAARIGSFQIGSSGAAHVAADLRFYTSTNAAGATEAMRIDTDKGIFCYGLLAASASTDVNINGSSELHSVTSSLLYKDEVTPLKVDPRDILKLKPRRYVHGADKERPEGWPEPDGVYEDVGFIAEEVYEVFPDAVYLRDGKPFSVKNSVLLAYIVAALKEMKN